MGLIECLPSAKPSARQVTVLSLLVHNRSAIKLFSALFYI